MPPTFWRAVAKLAAETEIVIDRPLGSAHPHYPDLVFPFNFGYLAGTSSADGGGIDVWLGSLRRRELTGIICSFDTGKRDAEIKLLLGCTPGDIATILAFNSEHMRSIFIANPDLQEG